MGQLGQMCCQTQYDIQDKKPTNFKEFLQDRKTQESISKDKQQTESCKSEHYKSYQSQQKAIKNDKFIIDNEVHNKIKKQIEKAETENSDSKSTQSESKNKTKIHQATENENLAVVDITPLSQKEISKSELEVIEDENYAIDNQKSELCSNLQSQLSHRNQFNLKSNSIELTNLNRFTPNLQNRLETPNLPSSHLLQSEDKRINEQDFTAIKQSRTFSRTYSRKSSRVHSRLSSRNSKLSKRSNSRIQKIFMDESIPEEELKSITGNFEQGLPIVIDRGQEEDEVTKEPNSILSNETVRKAIMQQSVDTFEFSKRNYCGLTVPRELLTAEPVNKPKTEQEKQYLLSYIKKLFTFNNHSEEDQKLFLNYFIKYIVQPGEIIYEQGNPSQNAYILEIGKLRILTDNVKDGSIKSGQMFGEIALLLEVTRESTVKCIKKSLLWSISRSAFRSTVEKIQYQNFVENRQFIESIPVITQLTEEQKDKITNSLIVVQFKKGDQIINAGDAADRMFILKEGQAQILASNQIQNLLKKGDFFGAFDLVNDTPRNIDVIACTDIVKCLVLIRDIVKKILGGQLQFILYRNVIQNLFQSNEILKDLMQDQIKAIIDSMKIKQYQPGEIVFSKTTSYCDTLYVVISGNLQTANSQECIESLIFCEKQIYNEEKGLLWQDDCIALNQVSIASISKQQLKFILKDDLANVVKENVLIRALSNVQILKSLDTNQLRALLKSINLTSFKDGETIVQQGTIGDQFYLIKSGQVDVFQDNIYKLSLHKFEYFGERSLLLQQTRSASVVARGPVVCWIMSQEIFNSFLGENIRKILLQRVQIQMQGIQLNELKCLKVLGSGMYATIVLCKHKKKDLHYILKCINRLTVDKYQLYDKINQERKILQQIDFPFIMKLVKTFKDSERVYFLNEFVFGMNFIQIINQRGLMKTNSAQFYIANILLILEYLHSRFVVYRDLKPVNLVCDKLGYLTLLDFRTAKIVEDRTYTLIGTPHYTAPEIINGKGYGLQVDIWALGIMLYEFVCAKVPFGALKDDPYEIYEEILKHNLKFPGYIQAPSPARAFIEQCLDINPMVRNNGNTQTLRSHDFFYGIDFTKLAQKELQAPYLPELTKFLNEIKSLEKVDYNIDEILDEYFELNSQNESELDICQEDELEISEEQYIKYNMWDKEF